MSTEVVGLSLDRRAPAWLRERTPSGTASRRELLGLLAQAAPERLVLHTCERLEVYLAAEGGEASELLPPLARWLGVSPAVLASHAEVYRGDAVVRHLFRVVAGLESRLIGEPQIRAQVREAFKEARGAGAVGPHLDALFRAALHTARLVRRETALGQGTSLAALCRRRLEKDLAGLRGRSVLVAGTGLLASEVAAALAAPGARLTIASRDHSRALALAKRFDADAVSYSDLRRPLARTDALVACTHGLLPIEIDAVAGRDLLVVDLGMPANVPVPVTTAPGVRPTRLDDLRASAAGPEIQKALAIVTGEHRRFGLEQARRAARRLDWSGVVAAA